ncbi:MAG: hypothetical protein ACPGU7_08955 [Gammaproteobacteria bacterium]
MTALFSLHGGRTQHHALELALYPEAGARWGYRVVLRGGRDKLIEVYRMRRGSDTLLITVPLGSPVTGGGRHELIWSQTAGGLLRIALDGSELTQLQDKAFKDAYHYLRFTNLGGDIALRDFLIKGR